MILLGATVLPFEYFPNGETKLLEQVIINHMINNGNGTITLKYEDDSDLMHLFLVKRYLDTAGYVTQLVIAYMPYSRMDRSEKGSAFTLKYVADFINAMNFPHVIVMEPHSDVTLALLNNVEATYPTVDLLGEVMVNIGFDANEGDYLFFPDAGAQKRYSKFIQDVPSAVGFKTRDFTTGKLEKPMVAGFNDHVTPRKIIIVDDLCSRGGTFLTAGKILKSKGADQIHLLVTHCEHNIFTGAMFDADSPIDRVFCTDTVLNWNDVPAALQDRLTVFKLIGAASGQ